MSDFEYEDDFSPEEESPNHHTSAPLPYPNAAPLPQSTAATHHLISASPPKTPGQTKALKDRFPAVSSPTPGRGSAESTSVTLNEAASVVTSAGSELKTSSVTLKIPKGSLDKETFVHLFEIGNDLIKNLDAVSREGV